MKIRAGTVKFGAGTVKHEWFCEIRVGPPLTRRMGKRGNYVAQDMAAASALLARVKGKSKPTAPKAAPATPGKTSHVPEAPADTPDEKMSTAVTPCTAKSMLSCTINASYMAKFLCITPSDHPRTPIRSPYQKKTKIEEDTAEVNSTNAAQMNHACKDSYFFYRFGVGF